MEGLRSILLGCGLTETLKWGKPCYTFQESNITIIQLFKASCALMFFKGVLLEDADSILEKHGKNSRIARRIAFTNVEEVIEIEPIMKSYIDEAIEVEKAGLDIDIEENSEQISEKLQQKLDVNPDLETVIKKLTLERQRGYILYFSDAKQSKTRSRRIEKYIPKILDGKGLRE